MNPYIETNWIIDLAEPPQTADYPKGEQKFILCNKDEEV